MQQSTNSFQVHNNDKMLITHLKSVHFFSTFFLLSVFIRKLPLVELNRHTNRHLTRKWWLEWSALSRTHGEDIPGVYSNRAQLWYREVSLWPVFLRLWQQFQLSSDQLSINLCHGHRKWHHQLRASWKWKTSKSNHAVRSLWKRPTI